MERSGSGSARLAEGLAGGISASDPLQRLLAGLREHLMLEVCFVSEVADGLRTFRFIEGDARAFGIEIGQAVPADSTYCQRMLDGVIPNIVADTRADPGTRDLAGTRHGIAAYIGVPVVLPSGRVYGTLCAWSRRPQPMLDDRDVAFLRMSADLIAEILAFSVGPEVVDDLRVAERLEDPYGLRIVFQPVVELRTRRIVGVEALSRFTGAAPESVFAGAWRIGLGEELELKAVSAALAGIRRLPDHVWISLNLSPRTLLSPKFEEALDGTPRQRLVVEVTEHEAVASYGDLAQALEGLLDVGVRLAIDDVGSGYSSLAHIVELSPDILKLDAVFTRGVESERSRRSLASAFVSFARDIDADVVVEGIETADELRTMRQLGIGLGQGFHLGMPAPIELLA